MQKLLTGLALASAFALSVSAVQACEFHAVSASVASEEVVAMSSVKDAATPVVTTTDQTCPAGQTNCAPAGK